MAWAIWAAGDSGRTLAAMKREQELIVKRLEVYLRDVVGAAVYSGSVPLSVGAHQSVEPISFAEARAKEFRDVPMGWRWGPVWSTCWFRLRGSVPRGMVGRPSVLRFSSGTEALLWDVARGPVQGLDVNRDAAFVFGLEGSGAAGPTAAGDVEYWIEAACNHPFGISCFEWDPVDHHKRWKSAEPGELERAELCLMHQEVWELHRGLLLGTQLLKELNPETERARQLGSDLLRAVEAIEDGDVAGSAADAMELVSEALHAPASGSTSSAVVVGHAHIDTAWLWPLRETRRKCLRTFSNVVGLMDRFEDFYFLCSQAQQYAYVQEDSPELFERIKRRVLEGRWEPGGGMWIEPDVNCPSGESLLRQCLHGARYWTSHFGEAGEQRFLYLPDTFGFPASIPGIMRHAGLDTFITNKMWWNQFNDFPHTTFRWRGVDGTEVLAHNTPGGDYNALLTPRELRKGDDRCQKTGGQGVYLQPFGYGDGGGGPTDWNIYNAQLAEDCDGLPRTRAGSAGDFCQLLHDRRAEELELGRDLPVWWGELYLEIHRGTLTTQGKVKWNNRRCEELLRLAEILTFAAPSGTPDAAKLESAAKKLDQAWKKLLLNQFHDILPGSSIGWVYKDAEQDYAFVRRTAEQLIEKGTRAWAAAFETKEMVRPLLVVNPGSEERSGVVSFDAGQGVELKFARGVPAVGAKVMDLHSSSGCVPVSVTETPAGILMTNGVIEALIDDCGRVLSLGRVGSERDACREVPFGGGEGDEGVSAGVSEDIDEDEDGAELIPINQLVMYEDRPHMWDAWDIDPGYEFKRTWINDAPAESVEISSEHPLRGEVRVVHKTGGSTIEQVFRLDAGSPRLDIVNKIDWRESHRLLRAIFPVDVLSERATYDIQYGVVERATHRNTSWDAAKIEVGAQRWMDVSEPGFGVAILNDGKYGHSCVADDDGGGLVMGISLLRSPKHPDPDADQGVHEFTYSIMPHEGDWRAAGVDREAEALNLPLRGVVVPANQLGVASWSPLRVETSGACGVEVSAIKPAEDNVGGALVVRLAETLGGRGTFMIQWNFPVKSVRAVDAIERLDQPHVGTDLVHEGQTTTVRVKGFEIVSLLVERG